MNVLSCWRVTAIFFVLLVSGACAVDVEPLPYRKVLPTAAVVRCETRIEPSERIVNDEIEKVPEAVVATVYFALQPGAPEEVVYKYFLKAKDEEDIVGATETLYLQDFRVLDIAQAKDRLLILTQYGESAGILSVALDKKGNPTQKRSYTTVIPFRWERRHEGFFPFRSAHLIALPDGACVLFVAEEGHKMFWEVSLGEARLVWWRRQDDLGTSFKSMIPDYLRIPPVTR